MVDINTHEFTLAALSALFEDNAKILKKVRWTNFRTSIKLFLIIGAGYYAYKNLVQKNYELEKAVAKLQKQNLDKTAADTREKEVTN